ncbi:MAG: endonuclease [Bacteroidales bacterium]|jgi:endonuclease I|nr:endonuclease [Bacteroidales bacterium]
MKKKIYFLTIIFLVLAVSIGIAQTPADSFPAYYKAVEGKRGAELKTALSLFIQTDVSLSYKELWSAFELTDRKSDGTVWDMYSTCTFAYAEDQCGNYQQECDCYNREHSFPKSWFGGEVFPMYTDLFHLYPTDGYVNNRRGNFPFGEVKSPTYTYDGSKLGNCSFTGYNSTVFEPRDEYKGDFARTYFYMVTRYETLLPSWHANNAESRPTLDGSTFPAFTSWQLALLLKWHVQDPVSLKEQNRNEAVSNIQYNRNPFIDYPDFVRLIWGADTVANEDTTGIASFANIPNPLKIYPNPAKDLLRIENGEWEMENAQILDLTGRIIVNCQLSTVNSINVSHLPAGMYLLRVYANKSVETRKIVITK